LLLVYPLRRAVLRISAHFVAVHDRLIRTEIRIYPLPKACPDRLWVIIAAQKLIPGAEMHLSAERKEEMAVTASTHQIMDESQRVGVQFLMADLTMGLTFLDVAQTTESEETRMRNCQNARTAYEAVVNFLPRVSPSDEEWATLEAKLRKLKDRLVALGLESPPW
jgi:hypothetical protein